MLKENYYLTNFHSLLEFVGQNYAGLLNDSEQQWLAAITSASESAQRLYVRLSNRRASVFRIAKLAYPEIESISGSALELSERGLASLDAPDDLLELVAAFTKPELIKLLLLQDQRHLNRADLVDHIINRQLPEDLERLQLADMRHSQQWIAISGLDSYTVFKLCFFGNCYQDMSEFVLRDLGVFNYEAYRIDSQSRVFHSRAQLDAHLQYFHCASMLELVDHSDVNALLQVEKKLPVIKTYDNHLNRRVDRLRNTIARQLERLNCLDEALAIFSQSDQPPSRERQVRLLMRKACYTEAHAQCEKMLENPVNSEEVQFVETITPKLNKQLGLKLTQKTRFRPLTSKLTLSRSDARVEMIARDFYAQFGECFYVENSLINGVLGLFIWDIIFSPVEGVFFNPFQSAPADFYQPEFALKRSALLEARFLELDEPLRFSARVWENYESKQRVMNPLVNWNYLTDDLLSLALIRIPVNDWRVLFKRVMQDFKNHTNGFPDLILFPGKGSYEMLEIKGPGDALQKNQKRWMSYFSEHRIPYRVVHIRWAKQTSPV